MLAHQFLKNTINTNFCGQHLVQLACSIVVSHETILSRNFFQLVNNVIVPSIAIAFLEHTHLPTYNCTGIPTLLCSLASQSHTLVKELGSVVRRNIHSHSFRLSFIWVAFRGRKIGNYEWQGLILLSIIHTYICLRLPSWKNSSSTFVTTKRWSSQVHIYLLNCNWSTKHYCTVAA